MNTQTGRFAADMQVSLVNDGPVTFWLGMSQLAAWPRVTRESTAMYHLRVPQTEEELDAYYHFRWEMLRKPLHQPKGSERDAWDAMAHHQMVVDEEGNLVAVDVCISMPTTKLQSALWPFIPPCRTKALER